MKKLGFMLAAAGLAISSAAFAGGHQFNQPMPVSHNYGYTGGHGGSGGYNNGGHNGGGSNHGGGQVITDPKNPASTRNWAEPQASSVYCIGANCHLTYPTPQQQASSGGTLTCNNRGCHRY